MGPFEGGMPGLEHAGDHLEVVAERFADAGRDQTDGLTIEWDDRWFNLRPSNTEPVLRLNVEAPDAAAVAELVNSVRAIVEAVR